MIFPPGPIRWPIRAAASTAAWSWSGLLLAAEGTYGAGAWYEHFNERSDAYDLTYTENGICFVSPAEGVYRYLPEEDRLELLVSGIACRILSCDEGLYATCSDSGEVYQIQDGTAELLLTLEKDPKIAVKPHCRNGREAVLELLCHRPYHRRN